MVVRVGEGSCGLKHYPIIGLCPAESVDGLHMQLLAVTMVLESYCSDAGVLACVVHCVVGVVGLQMANLVAKRLKQTEEKGIFPESFIIHVLKSNHFWDERLAMHR